LNRVGQLDLQEFTDIQVKQLANYLEMKLEFEKFERIDRSDKYIVCRISANYDCALDSETLFYKFATDRNHYSIGDIRVSFY